MVTLASPASWCIWWCEKFIDISSRLCCRQFHLIYWSTQPTLCWDNRSIWKLMTPSALPTKIAAAVVAQIGQCPFEMRSFWRGSFLLSSGDLDMFDDTSGWGANDNLLRNGAESGLKSPGHDAHCAHMERHREDCIRNQTWISTATTQENLFEGISQEER